MVSWPSACINIPFDVLKWGRLAISDGGAKIEATKEDGGLSRAEMEKRNLRKTSISSVSIRDHKLGLNKLRVETDVGMSGMDAPQPHLPLSSSLGIPRKHLEVRKYKVRRL